MSFDIPDIDDDEDYHANEPTVTAGADLDDAAAAVVATHGRGATARSIVGLAQQASDGADDVAILAPQAHRNTWYPNSFLAPTDRNQPHMASAMRTVRRAVDRAEDAGIDRDAIVLVGFSQGACLATEFIARTDGPWGGLAALSGGLIGPEGKPREYDTDLSETTAFFGCSDRDPHIPAERVHESADVLDRLGAEVTTELYERMGHTVIPDEIEHVQSIVTAARQ